MKGVLVKLTIEIDNLTEAQAIALEDMFATWMACGGRGSSRWTAFYADGDGNFRPNILVNGRKPEYTTIIQREKLWWRSDRNIENCQPWDGEYRIDFDSIAWELRHGRNQRP